LPGTFREKETVMSKGKIVIKSWEDGLIKGLSLRLTELKLGGSSGNKEGLQKIWSETVFKIITPFLKEKKISLEEWKEISLAKKVSILKGRKYSFERFEGAIEGAIQEYIFGARDC